MGMIEWRITLRHQIGNVPKGTQLNIITSSSNDYSVQNVLPLLRKKGFTDDDFATGLSSSASWQFEKINDNHDLVSKKAAVLNNSLAFYRAPRYNKKNSSSSSESSKKSSKKEKVTSGKRGLLSKFIERTKNKWREAEERSQEAKAEREAQEQAEIASYNIPSDFYVFNDLDIDFSQWEGYDAVEEKGLFDIKAKLKNLVADSFVDKREDLKDEIREQLEIIKTNITYDYIDWQNIVKCEERLADMKAEKPFQLGFFKGLKRWNEIGKERSDIKKYIQERQRLILKHNERLQDAFKELKSSVKSFNKANSYMAKVIKADAPEPLELDNKCFLAAQAIAKKPSITKTKKLTEIFESL